MYRSVYRIYASASFKAENANTQCEIVGDVIEMCVRCPIVYCASRIKSAEFKKGNLAARSH